MQPKQPLSLKGRALRLLSQREHSRTELARKLARHVQDGEDLAAVLDELAAKGLQSDVRAAEGLLRRRAGLLGVARIAQELRTKGLGGAPVAPALALLQTSELERARLVWQRKFPAPPADPQERGRHMRFLLARGFSGEVAARVLRTAALPDAGQFEG